MPTVPQSIEQADINGGTLSFDQISDHGELLFTARFNVCDGQGRPYRTGGGDKRDPAEQFISGGGPLETAGQLAKLRTSRDAFAASDLKDQKALVAFLKTLQIVPQGDDDDDEQ